MKTTPRSTGTSCAPARATGPTLRALDASDARVTVRLRNLVAFIESIQQAPVSGAGATAGAVPADGAWLFRTYCAPCHGTGAGGDGVMAGQLRRVPPNLTSFASRNGGVFPAERLRGVINGTGVASHGAKHNADARDILETVSKGLRCAPGE